MYVHVTFFFPALILYMLCSAPLKFDYRVSVRKRVRDVEPKNLHNWQSRWMFVSNYSRAHTDFA